ncbi:SCO7613 C-terminal domain-containing membrane protein [Streptomyces sp. MS06]|uniref:SCO7613 C-terminal domain-containing membrane protein n=1 Tax=Streptomyces sp. MS06 TaxID=3385974 RepID=UPI0039A234D1
MTHLPPPAEELRLIDAELRQLDARRSQLLARRTWLVGALQPARSPGGAPPATVPRRETGAPGVQNVLLILGGLLLTIAAAAFTLVGWGHLGIAGRFAVLGAVTLGALAAPLPLLGRGLRSTAESVAGLGLALTVLDAYALHGAVLPDAGGARYAAAAAAVLATGWAGYGRLPRAASLRLPRPAALAAAQSPLPLAAVAAGAGPYGLATALLVTALADTGAALRAGTAPVRATATAGAYGCGVWGAATAGWLCWTAAGPGAAARAAALLLLGAVIALAAAWRAGPEQHARALAVAGGLLAVAAVGGAARPRLPDAWVPLAPLAAGVALAAAPAVRRLPDAVRRGLAGASAAVQALAVLGALPVVATVLLGPVGRAARIWSGAPGHLRRAVAGEAPWPPYAPTVPIALAAAAAALVLAPGTRARWPWAPAGAAVLGWAALLVLPAALDVPYHLGLVMLGATAAAALGVAARPERSARPGTRPAEGPRARPPGPEPRAAEGPATGGGPRTLPVPAPGTIAAVLALLTSLPLVLLALATRPTTLTVLGILAVLCAAASARPGPAPLTAPAALGYSTGLACAAGAAAGLPAPHVALLVLVVPAAAAAVAPRCGQPRTAVAVEAAGGAAALLALCLAVPDLPVLALVLALCGVVAAATAVRPDRRAAGYVAAACFLTAGWIRLAAWQVPVVEAYTLPVTVSALVVGAVRRRRDPLASSWTAYGAGLAATLLPSLAAAWGDPHWLRPLLLGTAALVLTLLGGRHRLQAPLVLGGAVLLLDALHELAPYLVQVAGALPRWVPPALAGLLLLAVGATYERRLRDVRRVREILGGMT